MSLYFLSHMLSLTLQMATGCKQQYYNRLECYRKDTLLWLSDKIPLVNLSEQKTTHVWRLKSKNSRLIHVTFVREYW